MNGIEVPEVVTQWVNTVLVWIGYGTVVGLLAKAIMPGRDPGGALVTVLLGIAGSVIGAGTLAFFWEGVRVTPLSPLGFVVATAGAFFLLFFYRLLAGRFVREGQDGVPDPARPARGRKRITLVQDR